MEAKKPRLLYILHTFFNKGGTEEHTRHLLSGLEEDFETAVLAPQPGCISLIKDDKIIKKFPNHQVPWPVTPLNWKSAEDAFHETIREFSPEIIHIQHFFNWPLSIIDLVLDLKKPALMTLHDYYLISPYYTLEGKAKTAASSKPDSIERFGADITAYLQKRSELLQSRLSEFGCLITPSDYLAREMRDALKRDFRVIEHGIPDFEKKPKAASDKLRFAFVGSALPQKGWGYLLEAFKQIRDDNPNAELHLYGSSDDINEEALKKEKAVVYHGRYNREDLPDICAAIDVAFIPSVFPETFNLVLSEMWHAGVPVAASKIGTLDDRIADKVNGLKFIPGDVGSIKEALIWFLDNNEWRNWNLPKPRLLPAMLDEYRQLYKSLVGS